MGSIALIPLGKDGGPSVGGKVSEGRYEIAADKGPRRGVKYRVEFRSIDTSTGKPTPGGGLPIYMDRVPPAYNSQSQLTLAVPADSGNLEKDFILDSKTKR